MDQNNSLTLTHYKEPLRSVPKTKGYGYFGAILMTKDGTKIQCHVCGELFGDVGTHARQSHGVKNKEYKEKYQLAGLTSLISESVREDRKNRTLQWINSLTPEEKKALRLKKKKAYEQWLKNGGDSNHARKITLETKNKRGTCPDQLLAKIKEVATKLKRVPSKNEFIVECGTQRFVHLIYITFGSWSNAVKRCGFTPRKSKIINERPARYSDEELIEILSDFYINHKKIPTETDYRRGFIPSSALFKRRFGSMQKARQLAGIE